MEKKRILIDEKAKEIIIYSFVEPKKQSLLTVWLLFWTMAGIGIIAQFFYNLAEDLTIYLLVWLAFWAYFEYKVIYAFRWRRYGKEVIKVNDETLSINRVVAGRGIPSMYEISWIKNLRLSELKKESFFVAMYQSYWSPGDQQLTFDYKGRCIYFGLELSDRERKKILKSLRQMIQRKSV